MQSALCLQSARVDGRDLSMNMIHNFLRYLQLFRRLQSNLPMQPTEEAEEEKTILNTAVTLPARLILGVRGVVVFHKPCLGFVGCTSTPVRWYHIMHSCYGWSLRWCSLITASAILRFETDNVFTLLLKRLLLSIFPMKERNSCNENRLLSSPIVY